MCNDSMFLLAKFCFKGIIAHWAREAHPVPLFFFSDKFSKVDSRFLVN